MKRYEIFDQKDFDEMVLAFKKYFISLGLHNKPFVPLVVTAKKYKKGKSSKQHRAYWRCLSELKKAFAESGVNTNEDDLHQYVKYKSGFTKVVDGVTIVRSIADDSEDATSKDLNFLIDFIVRLAAERLNYQIEVGHD